MSAKTVRDLVSGNPREIWLLADSYSRMARNCEDVGQGFRAIDDGGWRGRAAEAFHARFEQQPRRLLAMADAYGHAAVALDTYAAALAWAQRQAGELIASEGEEKPQAPAPVELTVTQQAHLTGVISEPNAPEPAPVHVDQRAQALSTYRRALAMLDTVGNESAAAITSAAKSMPTPLPALPARAAEPAPKLVVHAVLPQPPRRTWFDPAALRDDPGDWTAAIKEIRKRLRWDGLDRVSPHLAQHIFEGHYRPSRDGNTGYHHREGGVDHGVLRVTDVISGPDADGVYKANVCGPQGTSTRTKVSTFFPDSWSRGEVLYAVRQAFVTAMADKDGSYDPTKRRFAGVYRGVEIVGHLRRGTADPRLCDIVTAYPRRVRNGGNAHEQSDNAGQVRHRRRRA
ncbi:EndoU domain-containing protein [Actinophytocola oryzae]|uniref:EndoU nuclease-like protein n=1 Tax=Actinophytocola oryzae TaxID=502181 RepID=A0A4R7VN69_9PSEU|nr:EndoU domain-containing protein [Actinophytocola oryzae]TDV51090.1 EndoU nuclease-like protein [Actinophytocola oryzae]